MAEENPLLEALVRRRTGHAAPDQTTERPPPPGFRLYAEVLQNTRSATVVAVLPEKVFVSKAELTAQGRSVVCTIYSGEATRKASVGLPAPMLCESGPADLRPPHQPTDVLCARLTMEEPGDVQVDGSRPAPTLTPSLAPRDGDVPWGAERMQETVRAGREGFVACGWCGAPLVRLALVRSWRNLPREGWEEALELWHCHKPHEGGGEKGNGEGGSGSADDHGHKHPATNRVYIAQGQGYSGLLYFLFDAQDCINLEEVRQTVRIRQPLACTGCKREVGVLDRSNGGWRLMKRDLKLRLKLHKEDESELQRWSTEQHSLEKWFAAELLQSIDYDGIRRFLVIPTGANANEGDSLMIWVFSLSLHYSTSGDELRKGITNACAMKIYWKHHGLPAKEPAANPGILALNVNHLEVPYETLMAVRSKLESGRDILPPCYQTEGEWQISLLDRFEGGDSGTAGDHVFKLRR